MTNGEKLEQVFPDGICPFSKNWLDYEYKEPTAKNDLEVDCISREATVKRLCNLAEYMNEHKENSGDPYIMAALFIQDNKTEFPSVTPQESKSEWDHDHEILKAYSDGANEVLDKIRAEIEAEPYISKMEVLDIIDKYKAESAHDVAQDIVKNNGVVDL